MGIGILLDADVPPAVAAALRRLGHEVIAASGDPALEAFGDLELLREATRQRRVLVTFNVVDFAEVARRLAHEQEDHSGVVMIHAKSYPRADIGGIARALDRLIRERESFKNAVLFLHLGEPAANG